MRHNQNRRSRGRGRKGGSPSTRNYESNGPDVKIRGTAAHVAEKYSALARDALSSGDPIAAENYFQHAEHFNRIIAAAQAQYQPAQVGLRVDQAEADQPAVAISQNGANVPSEDAAVQDSAIGSDASAVPIDGPPGDEDQRQGNGTRRPSRRTRSRQDSDGEDAPPKKRGRARKRENQDEDASPSEENQADAAGVESTGDQKPSESEPELSADSEGQDGDAEKTRDGAAALAAFPK